jgi:hypothetical protein
VADLSQYALDLKTALRLANQDKAELRKWLANSVNVE